MPTNDPVAALAAVRQHVAALQARAREAARQPGAHIRSLGGALIACARALGGPDTLATAKAGLAAVRAAHDDAAVLAGRHGSPWRDEAAAALKAEVDLGTIVKGWGPPPALGQVTIAAGPGDVQAGADAPTKIAVGLRRDGDLTSAASCGWTFTGLGPSALSDIAVFAIGSADAEAAVTVPAQPGMADPLPFSFEVRAPFVGLDPTPPQPVQGRLLPPGSQPPPAA